MYSFHNSSFEPPYHCTKSLTEAWKESFKLFKNMKVSKHTKNSVLKAKSNEEDIPFTSPRERTLTTKPVNISFCKTQGLRILPTVPMYWISIKLRKSLSRIEKCIF